MSSSNSVHLCCCLSSTTETVRDYFRIVFQDQCFKLKLNIKSFNSLIYIDIYLCSRLRNILEISFTSDNTSKQIDWLFWASLRIR